MSIHRNWKFTLVAHSECFVSDWCAAGRSYWKLIKQIELSLIFQSFYFPIEIYADSYTAFFFNGHQSKSFRVSAGKSMINENNGEKKTALCYFSIEQQSLHKGQKPKFNILTEWKSIRFSSTSPFHYEGLGCAHFYSWRKFQISKKGGVYLLTHKLCLQH